MDSKYKLATRKTLLKVITELEERLKWLDDNTTFFNVDHLAINGTDTPVNVPVLASVSKRIWYHATDDTGSYPFSAVLKAALEQEAEG